MADHRRFATTELEAERRAHQAGYDLPVEPYVGLTVDEARAFATMEGRELRVVASRGARTMDLRPRRVNVVVGRGGRITRVDKG